MPNIDVILSDFLRLKAACDEMSSKKIVVGIVGEVDSEVLKVAQIHEYGTEKMPERSFLRASFDADREKLGSLVSEQVNKVIDGRASATAAANAIGAQAAQMVQNFIDDALMVGVGSVTILHGKGTGALKEEIRRYLRTVPDIAGVADEHADRGGAGITVVTFGSE